MIWWRILLAVLVSLGFLACGGKAPPNRSTHPNTPKTATLQDQNGRNYVPADRRVDEELNRRQNVSNSGTALTPAVIPPGTQPPTSTSPSTSMPTLAERVREIEIARYESKTSPPTMFGTKLVSLKIWFTDSTIKEFSYVPLQLSNDGLSFNARTGDLSIRGSMTDQSPYSTDGIFLIEKNGEQATIFFRAYRAKLKIHTDRLKPIPAGSQADQLVQFLSDRAFGWVNNWSIIDNSTSGSNKGRSLYLIDIIKQVGAGAGRNTKIPPLIGFKGESLQTGNEDHLAQKIGGASNSKITLVGNSQYESRRAFAITINDSDRRDSFEIILDVQIERPLSGQLLDDLGAPSPDADGTADPGSTQPGPRPPITVPKDGDSFLNVDTRLLLTAQMAKDLESNRAIPGVKKSIAEYQKNFHSRSRLYRFFVYANPYRLFLSKMAEGLDVLPVFAYLPIVESSYFVGGQYDNLERNAPGDPLGALGPFQIRTTTASSLDLRISNSLGSPTDERRYFAPSACAAGRYIRTLARRFKDNDTTMAILAYNQGGSGASAIAMCNLDPSQCPHGTSRDYTRANEFVKRFDFKYADLDSLSAISKPLRDYVNPIIATYLMATHMSEYGVSIPDEARSTIHQESLLPPSPIQNIECRAIVNDALNMGR